MFTHKQRLFAAWLTQDLSYSYKSSREELSWIMQTYNKMKIAGICEVLFMLWIQNTEANY